MLTFVKIHNKFIKNSNHHIDPILGKRSLIKNLRARMTKNIEDMFQLIPSMITKTHPVTTNLNTTYPCFYTIYERFDSGYSHHQQRYKGARAYYGDPKQKIIENHVGSK